VCEGGERERESAGVEEEVGTHRKVVEHMSQAHLPRLEVSCIGLFNGVIVLNTIRTHSLLKKVNEQHRGRGRKTHLEEDKDVMIHLGRVRSVEFESTNVESDSLSANQSPEVFMRIEFQCSSEVLRSLIILDRLVLLVFLLCCGRDLWVVCRFFLKTIVSNIQQLERVGRGRERVSWAWWSKGEEMRPSSSHEQVPRELPSGVENIALVSTL
jgi:hypothetical protein